MSQLNFFFTNSEIKEILKEIKVSNEALIYNGRRFLTKFPEPETDMEGLGDFDDLTLWLINGYKKPECSRVDGGLLESQYAFDYLKDPIIEIQNCMKIDNLISPGRIYFKAGWIDNEELRKKHKKWANKVQRLFDKKSKLKIDKFWRVSPSLEQWVHNGGQLELGRNGMLINKSNINGA